MRNLALLTLSAVLCVLVAQQAHAQKLDQVPPPMPPVIEWPPTQTAELVKTDYAVTFGEAQVGPGITRPMQGARRPDLASQERCIEAPVEVTAASSDERRLACSAASEALRLLGRCNIRPKRPLQVHILSEVRHPYSGPIFGLFDTKQERVLVIQSANILALVKATPYEELPREDFYRSLIVHEVVHGVLHQNLKRPATSHAAYEYPAYALQIESLSPPVREKFLQSFDQTAMRTDVLFNDSVLFFDPFFFAAQAYHHFKAAPDGCNHLHALLQGEVAFIVPSR